MTKDQELAVLDRAIAELGRNSYLGPWLAEVRHEVERDVRNDFQPSATLAQARKGGEAIRERAQVAAKQILEQATREAKAKDDEARSWAERVREHARRAIREAEAAVNA